MYIFIAIVIGLIINYFTRGLNFNPILCFFGGLFLIMPSLLKFKFNDLKILFQKKNISLVILNLIIGFLLIPSVFFSIGYIFFGNSSITYAMLLLGFLPGGGMLFNFINKNGGDIKIGTSIFILNLAIFTIIFFPLNQFLIIQGEKIKNANIINPAIESNISFLNDLNKKNEKHCLLEDIGNKVKENISENKQFCPIEKTTGLSCGIGKMEINPLAVIIVLVIIPFLISRFILFSNKTTNFLVSKISILSKIFTFFIVGYIFTLKDINPIFSVEIIKLITIFARLFFSYSIIYLVVYFLIFKTNNSELNLKISVFLNNGIRFLTMGLIFSFIFSSIFGIDFVLVIAIAYITQPIFTLIFSNLIKKGLIK